MMIKVLKVMKMRMRKMMMTMNSDLKIFTIFSFLRQMFIITGFPTLTGENFKHKIIFFPLVNRINII